MPKILFNIFDRDYRSYIDPTVSVPDQLRMVIICYRGCLSNANYYIWSAFFVIEISDFLKRMEYIVQY